MKKRIELSNSIRSRHHVVISLSIVIIILIVIIMFSFDISTNSYNAKHVTRQQQNEGKYGYAYTYFSSQQAATAVIQNDYQLKDVSLQNSSLSSLPNIFKQVENSVVQITSKVSSNPGTQIIINGNPLGGQATRLGSGFVYDKQGHIISNSHVVNGAK